MSELEEIYTEIESAFSTSMNEGLAAYDAERRTYALNWGYDPDDGQPFLLTWKGRNYTLTITPVPEEK